MSSTAATIVQRPALTTDERQAVLIAGGGWISAARWVLWGIIATASIKPNEILGLGEQNVTDASSPIDLAFRAAVFGGCIFATFIALMARRVRLATLWFVPFCLWGFLVAVGQQSSFSSSKQLGSYLSWILFYIAATALLTEEDDLGRLRMATAMSVVVAAIAGILQHFLGHAPMIGMAWENMGFTRIHTGAGGILLDAGAPYVAALLFLTGSKKRISLMVIGVLLALWGSGNILRGGMVGFTLAMVWLITATPSKMRNRLLIGVFGVVVLVGAVFGGKLMQKSVSADDELNTSGRIETWPLLIGWIREEPVWGHGPNADLDLLQHSEGSDLRASHNELLSTAVNFGLVGLVLLWVPLLALMVVILWLAYHHRREDPEPLWGAGAAVIMLVTLSFTDNTLRTPGIMILTLSPVPIALNWCLRRLPAHAWQG